MACFWCVALQVKSFMLLVTSCDALKANLALSGRNKEALISMNCSENRGGRSCLRSQVVNIKLQALKL